MRKIFLILSLFIFACDEEEMENNQLNMFGCYDDDLDLNGDGFCFNENDLIGVWKPISGVQYAPVFNEDGISCDTSSVTHGFSEFIEDAIHINGCDTTSIIAGDNSQVVLWVIIGDSNEFNIYWHFDFNNYIESSVTDSDCDGQIENCDTRTQNIMEFRVVEGSYELTMAEEIKTKDLVGYNIMDGEKTYNSSCNDSNLSTYTFNNCIEETSPASGTAGNFLYGLIPFIFMNDFGTMIITTFTAFFINFFRM